ncbi:MAG: DegQ family serine endoprotease [Deltaproteobacteria bacterium]|jgi:serine protease Do|nr:DegQ family serine endoprotease [Deltaproteobacteria bacterium]MBW2476538.1 DegQ family serine endoprotease [Deltaproteobacteria bacterium]
MTPLFRLVKHLLAVLLITLWALPAMAEVPDFVELADQLKPAVVNIRTAKTVQRQSPSFPGPRSPGQDMFEEFFERFFRDMPQEPRKQRSLGSGFIISKDGYILTNDHVVNGADEIMVKLSDGREFSGEVRGLDPKLDLALVKIEAGESLPAVTLGDSDKLQVGEWLMAIGNPFGLEQTVTVGIVSATGRVIGAGPYDDFIQTDASINPGNSGGPLFNTRGEVVGINTAIVAGGQGIGFAIPVNMAKQIIPQLRDEGHVTRGWLGVTIQPMSEELAETFGLDQPKGALVNEVLEDSPAAKAGVKRGDIILEFDGKEIDEMNDLPRIVASTPIDKNVKMVIFREGKQREVKVTVGKLDDGSKTLSREDPVEKDLLGLNVANISAELAERYDLKDGQGVVITRIDPQGAAAEANLRMGDLVLEVEGQEVKTVQEFQKAVGKPESGKVLRFLVQRRQTLFYTTITVK